jgi:hypothetical protein
MYALYVSKNAITRILRQIIKEVRGKK